MYIFYSGPDERYAYAGTSKRSGKKTSTRSVYLGRVLDKEAGIYKSRERGIFHFDPTTGEYSPVPEGYVLPEKKKRSRREERRAVDFGDAFFLKEFLASSGLMEVIDTLGSENPDTLHAMVLYFALSNPASCPPRSWYEGNAASVFYPGAKLSDDQEVEDFLTEMGDPEKGKIFEKAWLSFVEERYGLEGNMVVESRDSLDERMFFVIQESTGLPLYRGRTLSLSGLGIRITSSFLDRDPGDPGEFSPLKETPVFFGDLSIDIRKKEMKEGDSPAVLYRGSRMDELFGEIPFLLLSQKELTGQEILTLVFRAQETGEELGRENYRILYSWPDRDIEVLYGCRLLSFMAACVRMLVARKREEAGLPWDSSSLQFLRNLKCTLYSDWMRIDPPDEDVRETYEAFGIQCPERMKLRKGKQ